MVEGGADEVSEELMLGALAKAQEFITAMCHLQDELKKIAGKEKLPLAPSSVSLENKDAIEAEAFPRLHVACFERTKFARHDAIAAVKKDLAEKYATQLEDDMQKKLFGALFNDMKYRILRSGILDQSSSDCWRMC